MFTKRKMMLAILTAITLMVSAEIAFAANPAALLMYPVSYMSNGTLVTQGVVLLSKNTGSATYCNDDSTSGKCLYIGTVGASITNGYQVVVNNRTTYILNKTTGDLYQCTVGAASKASAYPSTVVTVTLSGKCTAIANASTM